MSVLTKAVSIVSAAAMLAILSQGVAMANDPSSPSGAQPVHGPSGLGPLKVCTPKPKRPNYPLERGSPTCCVKPDVWQQQFSGGLEGTPEKHYWVCAPIPTPPK